MKRIAGWMLAAALLLTGCGGTAEVLPPEEAPALAEEAAAAYAAITADLTFAVEVEEEDSTVTILDVTPDNAWNAAGMENLFPICYRWFPAQAADWTAQMTDERGTLLTLTAPDGGTVLQCCSGGDVVRWSVDGTESYALAVNPEEGEPYEGKLYTLLDVVAEDAVGDKVWSGTVDGSVTDLTAVAERLAEQIAESYRTVPDFVTWKPQDMRPDGVTVFDVYRGQPEQFCCGMGFRLLVAGGPEEMPRTYWETGSGLDTADADGYYSWGREVLVEKNAAGDWTCVDWGTGGYSVLLPFGREENATLAELTDAFFLTEGFSHDWLLPYYLLDRPDLDGLPPLLDQRSPAEARELCAALAEVLREHPDYFENWTGETLREALGDYRDALNA